MDKLLRCACCALLLATGAWAAEEFSKRLNADDFAAAGLGKLTPAELARLDALVRESQNGELKKAHEETAAKVRETAEKVRMETAEKVRSETEAKVRAEVAAQKTAEPKPGERASLLNRMRVLLTPGTEIEYARVETQLVGNFRGYERGSVLTLANGQRWQVVEGSYWAPARDATKTRRVTIEPGTFGSFFLNIDDGGRPKVKLVHTGM